MRKEEIFDQVVQIMREDSATKKDIVGADPRPFRERIFEEMAEADFLYVMRSYLASFGIISHVSFHRKDAKPAGFRLRFYEDALYVEAADAATGLLKGDCIQAIDGQSISEVYQVHQAYFVSATPERHYGEWAYFVRQAKEVRLVRDGVEQQVMIHTAENVTPALFEAHYLNADTYYLRMENFMDEAPIGELYKKALPELETVKNLIIDVRINHGGSDSLYFPLFPYALSAGERFKDLEADEGYGMEILYTPTNVARRLAQFEKFLQEEGVSEETRHMLEVMSADLKANQDKGYLVYGDDEEDDDDYFAQFVGLETAPERIILLSDVMCGSSGDNFVDTMKKMPKVTVVGRPTLGILDYSNCCTAELGDYEFLYPTSRSLAVDDGKGMTDEGVLPDVYIPWTPEHLIKDVDLEKALQLLEA